MQRVMCMYCFQRLKCKKYGVVNVFRGFQAPRKAWFMFQKAERYLEWSDTTFQKLQNTKQGKNDVFHGKIESS